MNKQTYRIFDDVDAVFFTGDSLHDAESVKEAREMLIRWNTQLNCIEDIVGYINE